MDGLVAGARMAFTAGRCARKMEVRHTVESISAVLSNQLRSVHSRKVFSVLRRRSFTGLRRRILGSRAPIFVSANHNVRELTVETPKLIGSFDHLLYVLVGTI